MTDDYRNIRVPDDKFEEGKRLKEKHGLTWGQLLVKLETVEVMEKDDVMDAIDKAFYDCN